MTFATATARTLVNPADALERACAHLLSLQSPDGWWKGELETNICMDAEDLLLREFLGIRTPAETAQAATWIRSQQHPDGGWAIAHGAPVDLSASVEGYAALRLAGDPANAAHMRRAREQILELGGLERSRVFTRIWLALFGLWSWQELPALPPEIILLPPWFPLNIYDFASWARQTIVPLTIVSAHRPKRPIAFSLHELWRGDASPRKRAAIHTWSGAFERLDSLLHRYERRPWRRLRQRSLQVATEWIVRRQEADGCWGGIQPPWVYSLMALHLLGYPLDHPIMKKGLEGLDRFAIIDDRGRRMEACQSPVWDTCLAALALLDGQVPGDHPALVRAAGWLMDQEIRHAGDWAVRRPNLQPSGWAFEFENDTYPDIDDTAEVILALRQIDHPDRDRRDQVIARARAWVLGMQCRDGGFAAFDVDNVRGLCREIPFCDFGEVIDPPSADVTAHVLEMLAAEGLAGEVRGVRARDWLLRAQEADGSWFGRWGVNHIYGCGAAVPALRRAGLSSDSAAIAAAVRWIEAHQNDDGGWGEDVRSYETPAWRGRGKSTASQTAWALLALLDGDSDAQSIERGIDYLIATQREDGGWDEEACTGTGFPSDFYIKYHMYRLYFPIMALGRFVRRD
ncbi:MAG TPA: squalene--hopene cyclase [Terriglobales bacterium]|nr:squalene--hopene cyclase [Terriglobales bacterium]